MNERTQLTLNLNRVHSLAGKVWGIGMLLLAVGFLIDREQFFRSYLFAYLVWVGPCLGSMSIVMLHNLTGGAWGFAIRRLLEAGMRTIPALAVLFAPLVLGIHHLYEWSHAEVVAEDPILQAKAGWLNETFFIARTIFYFAVWVFLSRSMLHASERYDRTLHIGSLRRIQLLSGFGLCAYVLTMSFAAFDWAMSLEPHWFSTIYGLQYVVGQALGTLCLAIIVSSRLARHEPFSRWLKPTHFHDLGNLLLAFVLLWAYLSFSQFLIVWSGNLPEETPWYLRRIGNGWQAIALTLVLFHFFVPFLVLLIRRLKKSPAALARVAAGVFAMRFLDIWWQIGPAFHDGQFRLSWMDLVAPLALGALWIWLYVRYLRERPLVSLQDAKLLGDLEEVPSS